MALRTSPTPIHNSYLFTTTPISSPDTPISSPPLPCCHHHSYLTIKHYHLITTTPIYHHHSYLITATLVSSPTLPSHHQLSYFKNNNKQNNKNTNSVDRTVTWPPTPPPQPPLLSFQVFLFLVACAWKMHLLPVQWVMIKVECTGGQRALNSMACLSRHNLNSSSSEQQLQWAATLDCSGCHWQLMERDPCRAFADPFMPWLPEIALWHTVLKAPESRPDAPVLELLCTDTSSMAIYTVTHVPCDSDQNFFYSSLLQNNKTGQLHNH